MDIKKAWGLAVNIARMELKIFKARTNNYPKPIIKEFQSIHDDYSKAASGCSDIYYLMLDAKRYAMAELAREEFLDATLLRKLMGELEQAPGEFREFDSERDPEILLTGLRNALKEVANEGLISKTCT